MSIKEKIAQYYLTFIIFSFVFSKKLVFIPFILDIKIKNRFLLDIAQLFFEPINFAISPFEYILATSGSMMMLIIMGLFVFLIGLVLLIIESFFLAKLIIVLGKSVLPKNIFGNAMASIRNKMNVNNKIESSGKFESVKKYLPVLVFIVLLIILYPILTNFIKKNNNENNDKNKTTLLEQANEIEENIDFDNDGLSDKTEFILGIDRYSKDSDSDGFSDYDELKNGHHPLIISPQDKLSSDMQAEIQKVLFSNEKINFSKLESIRNGIEKQISEKLCQNDNSSYENLSDKDKTRNAVKLKNPCICSGIVEIKEKNYCFSILGALLKDESLCSYVLEEGREEINGFFSSISFFD